MSDKARPASLEPSQHIYTVSQLNSEVRQLLEGSFPLLWVEGEISNFACPSSGHWYFTLKDEQAQVRCAMFRNRNQLARFRPANGMQIQIRARVGLYEGRGEFQLIAEHMQESGDGALQRAFEELKQKLSTEGLFDPIHKKPLPTLPRSIGLITSPTGAAIKDVLSVLQKRFPAIHIIVYPVRVQGEQAANEMVTMLELADARKECDVLLLTRGGGSQEDLNAFNQEALARAIFACELPVIAAVGHEIDFTIADFVADYRAPTPSAAAEHISPDQKEWLSSLNAQLQALTQQMQYDLLHRQQDLSHLQKRLQQLHPGNRLKQWMLRIDDLELRYQRRMAQQLDQRRLRLNGLIARLKQQSPVHKINQLQYLSQQMTMRLHRAIDTKLNHARLSFTTLTRTLDTVSPLATLERGYSILLDDQQHVVSEAKQVKQGDRVHARLAKGSLKLTVTDKESL
jgi:exodeoxyribonuclease VII large subunit